MHVYYCFITAMLASYQDGIVAGMAKRGYMIGSASKNGKLVEGVWPDAPSVVIALGVYKPEETTAAEIYKDIDEVCRDMKTCVYSIVISYAHEAVWQGPNFLLPANSKA